MNTKIDGQLEIDINRGVVYFHSKDGITKMRIQGLPYPMKIDDLPMLDIGIPIISVNPVIVNWKTG